MAKRTPPLLPPRQPVAKRAKRPIDWGRHPSTGGTGSIVTLPDDRLQERRGQKVDTEGQVSLSSTEVAQLAQHGTSRENDTQILALARQRFRMSAEAETMLREEMVQDQRFYAGEQWPDQIRTSRTSDQRPIITINRLPQFVKQITNPQRAARPSIQINPVSDGANEETAEIFQGVIRHIEHNCHAEVAYDEAYEDAVVMGRGWFRILTDYVDDGSFEQEIIVKRIPNALAVYPDPAAEELDYSDGRFLFIVEDIPKDEYRDLYGDASMASLELFTGAGNRAPDWFPEGRVRIAEYFYVELKDHEIALIQGPTGEPMTVPSSVVPDGVPILRKRTIKHRIIHWVKMNAAEILEHKIWPGRWIPVVPVLGDEVNVDGRRTLVGIVRYARDPQRMYNYWVTAETETIALAPRAPFIGAAGQFKGHETEWKQANVRNFPYLEYEMVDFGGKPAPPPQRQQFEPPIKAIADAVRQSDNDLKSVIGFYDASLGQPGPDQSGKAILARQKQGETGNMNFLDNLTRALWHAGRIYVDLAPKVYDTKRVLHIMGDDDQQKRITINNDGDPSLAVEKIHDIRVGRYGVEISTGPSYESKRQEAVASMLQLVKANPNSFPVIGDLLVGEMDWPMAKAIAARLKKMLPAQLQDEDDQQHSVQQLEAKLHAAETVLQAQNKLMMDLQTIVKEKRIEAASKEFQVMIQERSKMAIALVKVNSSDAQKQLDVHIGAIDTLMDSEQGRISDELSDIRQAHLELQAAHAAAHAASTGPQPPPEPAPPGGAPSGA